MYFILILFISISHFTNFCAFAEKCTSETLDLLMLASRTSPLDTLLFSRLQLAVEQLQAEVSVKFPISRVGLATYGNEPCYILEQPLTFSPDFSKLTDPCVDPALEAVASAMSDGSGVDWGPDDDTRKIILLFLPNYSVDSVCSVRPKEVETHKAWELLKENNVGLIIIKDVATPKQIHKQWVEELESQEIDYDEIDLHYDNINEIDFKLLEERLPPSRCAGLEGRSEPNSFEGGEDGFEEVPQPQEPLENVRAESRLEPSGPESKFEPSRPEVEVKLASLEGRNEEPPLLGQNESRQPEPEFEPDSLANRNEPLVIEGRFERVEIPNEDCEAPKDLKIKLRLSFLVDHTNTFSNFWTTFSSVSSKIMKKFKKSHPGSKYALSVFCDYDWANLEGGTADRCYNLRQTFTEDSAHFSDSVNNTSKNICDGGKDQRASSLTSIFFAAVEKRVGWKSTDYDPSDNTGIKKMIIFFSDKMTHDDTSAPMFQPQLNRHPAKGDGSDDCLNSFPPSFKLVGEKLRRKNIDLVGFVTKPVQDYWIEEMKVGMGIENPRVYDFDLRNVERLENDIYKVVEICTNCDSWEWEDPPAYNTLGY